MSRYEQTRLWQSTLATQLDPDSESAQRRKLRTALEDMRERSKVLAAEIARDLPEFTVHDISHIDALWEMAQLILPEGYPITPAEAFVLGGAFLIHDLGMGLAAYPLGVSEIRQHVLWRDTVAAALKRQLGRTPTDDEIQGAADEVQRQATGTVLRQLHAERAESLASTCWSDDRGRQFYLIEDPELRGTYARVMGLVAHSHWWAVDELEQKLPKELGAPGRFANAWTVNALKLACILRSADIVHLDERRAPAFLRALRRPFGIAAAHWTFQEKLYQPRLEADRLVYSAKMGFTADEASAWWLCYDTLREVDRELEQVDSLLADLRLPRLAARGLAYIEKPARLAKLIPTEGWYPVDAQVRVGAVASLVAKLGGAELYGENLEVPLRELIQNGADAIRARRALEDLPVQWGTVRVRFVTEGSDQWIEITDTGVGMSAEVLTGPFLDFGTSFWGSEMMHLEFPGLESTSFESTGKYGIGFFSVFMWGDRVQVISRRYEKGREDTKVLDFEQGLASRPMLRAGSADELLKEGGTRIRVRLGGEFKREQLLQRHPYLEPLTLGELCAKLCATLDVNVEVSNEESEWEVVVTANDWVDMDGEKLLLRVNKPLQVNSVSSMSRACQRFGKLLKPVYSQSDELVGRAVVTAHYRPTPNGLITVGGFASSPLNGVTGVLLGRPMGASRNSAEPLLTGDAVRRFAADQIPKLKRIYRTPDAQHSLASVVHALGGIPNGLPVARSAQGWLDPLALKAWAAPLREILLIELYVVEEGSRFASDFRLEPNVLACDETASGVVVYSDGEWPASEDGGSPSFFDFIIGCIAQEWLVAPNDIQRHGNHQFHRRRIALAGAKPIIESARVLVRP